MKFLYTLSVYVVGWLLKPMALFNKKIKLFTDGRKDVFSYLEKNIEKGNNYIWVHTASLGEFEQGLPVIKELKKQHKIIVTFFSPSGYEVRKNTKDTDIVAYLPLDTPSNAQKFIEIVRPKMAIFVKYEFWIHYLTELKNKKIPTYLLSGIFRKNQVFFKWYGTMMRDCLHCFTHFFLQNEESAKLLQSIGFENVTVSGDTRFDRVAEILNRDNTLSFIADFKQDTLCVVFGSSWEADEDIYLQYINHTDKKLKFIIAPHHINPIKLQFLRQKISKKTVFFSEKEGKKLSDFDVFIIDTVGILTKIYSYADIAYVGGGMGNSGLHNVLEPAVFGIPVVIGKNYAKFAEAVHMVQRGGITTVSTTEQLNQVMDFLVENPQDRHQQGKINVDFIAESKGATQTFLDFLECFHINQHK